MATQYTPTQGSQLITLHSGDLSQRIQIALGQKCLAMVQSGTASASDLARIAAIGSNPVGYANRLIPVIVSALVVATPADASGNALLPTDAELVATIDALWPAGAAIGF